ncbi:apolipoprotein N-acyltransferase [Streptomyces roseirectus]|uniref:Apolipoprotein N-acyltransferase n=1 Tax=Streptomyces roseirectus TaxID=2768066 RepID=A0A7H0IME5_9ACTN|nr:apolipoprotein N-acyltransferase [Streptomyces roseirectus]QNP73961.1 apolipoprotein N-acyltransferase [Streptomyces roseirectus]
MTTHWLASPRRRTGLAVLAGALPVLAFPAPSLWWWAYGALVPWLLLVRTAPSGRRALYEGWAGGFGFMLGMHHWLLPSLNVFTFVIAGLLGALWAPWGWVVRRLLGGEYDRRPGRKEAAVALVVLPSGWLAVELVRSWQGLGGPWGMLGASQWEVGPALRLASVGGVWLLTLLVVAVNTAVALLVAASVPCASADRASASRTSDDLTPVDPTPSPRPLALAALLALAVLTVAVSVAAPRPETTGRARIALVQAGVVDGPDRRFEREERLTRELVGQDVDLIVWGESSVGYDLKDRPDLAKRLAALAGATGADLLVNVDARRSDRPGIYKSSILVGPDGPTGDRYDKMRLVPFGEYIPARSLLGWATSVGKAAGEDRRRGTAQTVMEAGPELRFGPMICFETAFPDMSRNLARKGVDLLVAQSSTSSFQHSWAPAQHASLAALRAAETGRTFVHATLTGDSVVHGPDGRRIGRALGTSVSGTAVYEVPLSDSLTVYDRYGDWAVYAALLALAGYAVSVLRGRTPRARPARTVRESPARPVR